MRVLRVFSAVAVIALILSGCGVKETKVTPVTSQQKHGYPIQVTDDRGKTVTVNSEPKRIVSLTPSDTEILFALGLGDRIVGVTKWCDFPEEAKKKTQVGDVNISVEKVVSLSPDLIIAHATLNDSVIRQLEGLGKTVIALDPKNLEEINKDISLIALACKKEKEADILNCEIIDKIKAVSESSKSKTGARTLVAVQANPLWAAGPETLADEMLAICRAENVARDARPGYNTFPIERALARDPQVIIVGKEDERDFFLNSPVWKNTTAVKSQKVVVINPDLLVRPGPRISQGLVKLAESVMLD
ncbi:MAG: ABC transporter substrate-binding protein [Lentisphaerae bacterium]|nr:ABC transporter substrate-binding protein [Lentisphaerota bacterium]